MEQHQYEGLPSLQTIMEGNMPGLSEEETPTRTFRSLQREPNSECHTTLVCSGRDCICQATSQILAGLKIFDDGTLAHNQPQAPSSVSVNTLILKAGEYHSCPTLDLIAWPREEDGGSFTSSQKSMATFILSPLSLVLLNLPYYMIFVMKNGT